MKKPYSMEKEKSALDLVEEGFHLLRSATPGTYAAYLLGTVPFLLALLFFWSDMSRSPFAAQRLVSGALGLALLFCWMKLCQTVFAARLLAQVSGEGSPRWTASRLWQAAVVQTILQPLGLLLIPVSLALLFPFAWVYSFFQNATVLGSDEPRVLSLMAKSWRGARLWPTQNHALLLMLKGLGLIILIDLFLGWVGAMYLLQSFFGIQTAFTQSQWAFLNTTFFAVILSLAYLCLDPLIKTIYVLRCFYGESLHSGRDLKAELKSLQRNPTALLAAMLFLTCLPALSAAADPPPSRPTSSAERSAVTPAELDQSIEKVLRKREYTWRLPRNTEALEKSSKENAFFKKLAEWSRALRDGMDRFVKWLTRGKKPNLNMPGSGEGWFTVLRGTMVLLLLAVVCSIGWLLVKIWRRYERDSIPTLSAEPLGPSPDLNDESIVADQLPEEGWLRLARELCGKGEFRLAIRALYLASLSHLSERRLLTIARFKSNREYQVELARRAHMQPELLNLFENNVSVFERIWYGMHAVNADIFEQIAHNVERMKSAS